MHYDYNLPVDRSGTNAEKYTLRKQLFGTEDVLPMWVADMDIPTPPFVVAAVKKRAEHPVYGYEEMPDSAFEAQMAWMQRRHGIALKREWMLFSPSVVATINVAIQAFTQPGEGVIVQPPVYHPFSSSISNNGRRIVSNPLKRDEAGEYHFDFDDLRAKIDKNTRLLLLCSPHNPVGRVWRRDELQELADICLEHGITVLADEIHSDLVYASHKHIPFASLSDAVRDITVTAIGPGKSFNLAGLSISTVVIAGDEARARFEAVHKSIHFAQGTIFGHTAFEAAYREGDAWMDGLKEHLQGNFTLLESLVAEHSDKLRFRRPEGTYLTWIDCSQLGLSNRALRRFFIEEAKLGLSPGISFGKEGDGYMRLNAAVGRPVMQHAMARLHHALAYS